MPLKLISLPHPTVMIWAAVLWQHALPPWYASSQHIQNQWSQPAMTKTSEATAKINQQTFPPFVLFLVGILSQQWKLTNTAPFPFFQSQRLSCWVLLILLSLVPSSVITFPFLTLQPLSSIFKDHCNYIGTTLVIFPYQYL
jgi:hypothetical protein